MSIDVARLAVVTNASVDLETRCRSIARNAVQASREAHGRGNEPYTDDEVRRERIIERALALSADYAMGGDHEPLVSEFQPNNPTMARINDILEKGLEAEIAAAAPAPTAKKVTPVK